MFYRSLQAKGVWCGAVAVDGDRICIGALVLMAPKGLVMLKDRDTGETVAIDLSGLSVGTSYSVNINASL